MGINDQVVAQVRYLRRLVNEAPRNDDGLLVIGPETESDMKDSLNRAEESLTGKPCGR